MGAARIFSRPPRQSSLMIMRFMAGLLVIISACSADNDPVGGSRVILELAEKYDAEAEAAPSRRAPEMLAAFERNLGHALAPARLTKLGDEEVELVFDAASTAAFYSEAEPPVLGMETVAVELARRGLATAEQTRRLHERFMTARLWSKARLMNDIHPDLPPVPEIRESSGTLAAGARRVYEISKGGKVLTLKELSWGAGPKVVMLSSPICSRSRSASADIEGDPILRAAFAAHALRLNAPKLALSAEALAPGAYVAYKRADWPGLELVLRYKVEGWPSAERKRELLEGFKRIRIE